MGVRGADCYTTTKIFNIIPWKSVQRLMLGGVRKEGDVSGPLFPNAAQPKPHVRYYGKDSILVLKVTG